MLIDRTTDQLLQHLEKCGELYAVAKRDAAVAEWAHNGAKAAAYNVNRAGSGMSVEDAKTAALSNPTVASSFLSMIDAILKRDRAWLRLERARGSIDLWRSEQANLRRV